MIQKLVDRFRALGHVAFGSQRTADNVLRLADISRLPDSSREKYDETYVFLSELAAAWGFEMYNRNLMWQNEEAFLKDRKSFSDEGKGRADRKFIVWNLANYAKNIEGDTAECGVWLGASSHLICCAIENKKGVTHNIFDSFEGLSEPDALDSPKTGTAFVWKKGDLSIPLERVKKNLSRFPFVKYHKGWIPEKFHEVQNNKFSFVHVDVDLYQPTKDSLEFFYERLSPGGVLLCDDYGYETCPGARQAFDELVVSVGERPVIHLPTGQGLLIKK